MKYAEWLDLWLNNYVRPSAKERTYIRYKELVLTHIAPNIGDKALDELTPIMLQSLVAELLSHGNKNTCKGLATSTVNIIITVIQNSLSTAYFAGLTSKRFNAIKRPKPLEKKIECFTVDEQKKIESKILAGGKDKLFGIVLCLYTGLRIGELLALKWSDIDLQKGLLTVSHSCHDRPGGVVLEPPKTPFSCRTIPLVQQLLPRLKNIKKFSKSAFVVSGGHGSMSVRSYQRSFELLLNDLHIAHRGFHTLRHTFATRALECGMDVKTLAEILGHKNPTVTLNRYVHSLPEHKSAMINRLGKLLSPKN